MHEECYFGEDHKSLDAWVRMFGVCVDVKRGLECSHSSYSGSSHPH